MNRTHGDWQCVDTIGVFFRVFWTTPDTMKCHGHAADSGGKSSNYNLSADQHHGSIERACPHRFATGCELNVATLAGTFPVVLSVKRGR